MQRYLSTVLFGSLPVLTALALPAQGKTLIKVNWPAQPRILHKDCRAIGVGPFKFRTEKEATLYKDFGKTLYDSLQTEIRAAIADWPDAKLKIVGAESRDFWDQQRKEQETRGREASDTTLFGGAHIKPTLSIMESDGGEYSTTLVKRNVRSISMFCTISLYYKSGEAKINYSDVIVWSDSAEQQLIPGIGKKESALDFKARGLVFQYLIRRHARAFAAKMLGLAAQPAFEIRNASSACRDAVDYFNKGNMRMANRKAVQAIQSDRKSRKQNGHFIQALVLVEKGDLDEARQALQKSIAYGRKASVDTSDYERALQYVDQRRSEKRPPVLPTPSVVAEKPTAKPAGKPAGKPAAKAPSAGKSAGKPAGETATAVEATAKPSTLQLDTHTNALLEKFAKASLREIGNRSPSEKELREEMRSILRQALRLYQKNNK